MKIEITLSEANAQALPLWEAILHKERDVLLNEALLLYFKAKQEELDAKSSSQTDLSYDEFWDDVDI